MTNPLPTAEVPETLAPPPALDRRVRWQRAKLAQGLCSNCGKKPVAQRCDGTSAIKCTGCLVKSRTRERVLKGWKPRYVSGLGRPLVHGAKLSAEVVT